MENKMFVITESELNSIKELLNNQSRIWVAEIDGRKVPTWKDYAREIERAFRFPTPCDKSVDTYLDWIRDLDWLDASGYVLIIEHMGDFVKDEPEKRKMLMETFEDYVLPWWQSEIESCVVGGKPKPFSLYLVD